jgi:hypothetical protein
MSEENHEIFPVHIAFSPAETEPYTCICEQYALQLNQQLGIQSLVN